MLSTICHSWDRTALILCRTSPITWGWLNPNSSSFWMFCFPFILWHTVIIVYLYLLSSLMTIDKHKFYFIHCEWHVSMKNKIHIENLSVDRLICAENCSFMHVVYPWETSRSATESTEGAPRRFANSWIRDGKEIWLFLTDNLTACCIWHDISKVTWA